MFYYPNKRNRITTSFEGDPGLTRQAHKKECDINAIMAKYYKTGGVDFINKKQAFYSEFPSVDLLDATLAVQRSAEMFNELTPQIRKRFDNDPVKLLAFLDNIENREEAVSLGLLSQAEIADLPPAQPPEAVVSAGEEPVA